MKKTNYVKNKKVKELILTINIVPNVNSNYPFGDENDIKVKIPAKQMHLLAIDGIAKIETYFFHIIGDRQERDTDLSFSKFIVNFDEDEETKQIFKNILKKEIFINQIEIVFENATKDTYVMPIGSVIKISEKDSSRGNKELYVARACDSK